jgi:hypothetical protein
MKAILIAALLASLAGCAMRMYGHMSCDGKCELVIDREVDEFDPAPLPELPDPIQPKK